MLEYTFFNCVVLQCLRDFLLNSSPTEGSSQVVPVQVWPLRIWSGFLH